MNDLNSVLLTDYPMYADAVEAMKRYHQAQAEGVSHMELERLRLLAEHSFRQSLATSCAHLAAHQGLSTSVSC